MRIHTRLNEDRIRAAAKPAGVAFERLTAHGSRKRDRAFDVILSGSSNRRHNDRGRSADYAATWDEWGIFLRGVFEADPRAIAGNAYDGAVDFGYKTGGRYETLKLKDQHRNHKWEYLAPGAQGCKCGAERRFM